MKIKIEIELPIEVVGNDVIIKSHEALNKLFGSSATASNLHLFGIEKLPSNTWKVPLSKLRERYKDMVQKVDDMQQKTIIMRQILDSIDFVDDDDIFSKKSKKKNVDWSSALKTTNKTKKNGVKPGTVRGPYKKIKTPKKWTRDEWNIIKNNLDKSPKDLKKFFPQRTMRAIITARSKMRSKKTIVVGSVNGWTESDDKIILDNINESFSKDKMKEISKLLSVKRSNNSISMRKFFLNKRMKKEKVKRPVMISVEKPVAEELGFPKFSMIKNTKFVLETTKHNLMGKGKLEFRDLSWIPTDTEWTEDLWNIFITEFMENSKKIAEFLGVENKFAIDNDGTMKRIIYRIKEEN